MARLNEQAVRAFTVGFSDTDAADERPHAAAVAKALGAEHIQIDFTENDFWTTAPKVAWAMDDPVADLCGVANLQVGRSSWGRTQSYFMR